MEKVRGGDKRKCRHQTFKRQGRVRGGVNQKDSTGTLEYWPGMPCVIWVMMVVSQPRYTSGWKWLYSSLQLSSSCEGPSKLPSQYKSPPPPSTPLVMQDADQGQHSSSGNPPFCFSWLGEFNGDIFVGLPSVLMKSYLLGWVGGSWRGGWRKFPGRRERRWR